MKNIIIAFLFCLPLFSQAQIFQDTGHKSKALWATSLMKPPADTLSHKQGIAIKNGVLYYGNNINWVAASAGASGAYLLIADTASMLSNYARKAIADSTFFKSVYGKRTQSGRFVFNKTALAWDSLKSFKITDSTRSSTGKLYGHETKFINGFEEAPYDSLYISRIKVNAATGVELSFSDQNNSDTNNIVKVDANGFTINIPSKGTGKVLQSDVNGNATWVTPTGGTTYTGTAPIVVTGSVISADTTKAQGKLATFNDIDIAKKSAWSLLGNAGTNPTNNFIGTTDAQPLKFRTNNNVVGTFGTDYSIAMGLGSVASNNYATSIGGFNTSAGFGSTSFGYGSYAGGAYAVASGLSSYANGYSAFASGNSTEASGASTASFGEGTKAKSYGETAIGLFNTVYTPTSTTAWSATDRLFGIGNGTGTGATSDAVTVLKNGNVGMGISTPTSTLSTNGSISTTLVNKSANYTATAADNTINVTTAAVTITLPTAIGIQGREYTIINSTSGNITITTTASQTIGNFVTTTSFTLATDKALKVQSDNTNYKIK